MGTPCEQERTINALAKDVIHKLDTASNLPEEHRKRLRTQMIFCAERAHAGVLCCGQQDDALAAIGQACDFLQQNGVE